MSSLVSAGYTDEGVFFARQSILATASRCSLSARFELEIEERGMRRYMPELSRGTLAHRVVAEVLNTLWRTGQQQLPPYDGIAIMDEVLAQVDEPSEEVLFIPPEERVHLRKFVSRFCEDWKWEPAAFLAIERRLEMPITCPDGVVRLLTGQPDILMRGAPDELIVPDVKSGFGPPKTPRTDDPKDPRAYLTARGHYQLDSYGLLGMYHYPRAQRCTLRELHPMAPEERQVREAELRRENMAEVEYLIGADLMNLERALREGKKSPIWKAVPGEQCRWCVKRIQCPRNRRTRLAGAINTPKQALDYAGKVIALTPYRTEVIDACKAWVDVHGPIDLGDGRVLGWHVPPGRVQRKFEAHYPIEEPEQMEDPVMEQLKESLEQGAMPV